MKFAHTEGLGVTILAGLELARSWVTVASKKARDGVLEKASRLKDQRGAFSKICVKKDIRPAVREEWKRLRTAETIEKERPENQGCTIRLDVPERNFYRSRMVIDKTELSVFLRRPQNQLIILSWNVNGIKTKSEKPCVYNILLKYDIICL